MTKAYPISIQFLMVVKNSVVGYTSMLHEHLSNAQALVMLASEGKLTHYSIENFECENDSFYVDLLFADMKALENEYYLFKEPTRILIESECGELIEVNHLLEHSIVEVAEHTEFETILYNPITLEPLED